MIETFILYNAILLLSVLFAYYAEHSKTRRSRILARYSLFMVLFVPSVLRYDIGTDYASYVDSFNFSSEYKQTEIVFYALILFLRNLQLPAHSLFVCSAFITYFPLLFLQRKNYTWKILMYVLLCYLLSYSAIRNMISLSLVILAFDLFFRGKRWGAFIIYPLSVLFHASSFVFLPFFFVNRMHCNRIILLLISSFLLCICYTDMFFVLLNNDLFLNSYYGGYMFNILIVEDDKELSQLFQKVLEKNGYQVKCASDGMQALETLDTAYIDLIISDIMMPVMDGYELVSRLRAAGYQIPVLMITAKGTFDDMRQGFLSGSDDYMVKPVNVNEMVLRVGALLRRAQILSAHKIIIGSTEFDYDQMTVKMGSEIQVLPKKEFLILYKLAASPGRTFTKQQLMDDVWGVETEADPHTIEVHIGRIRERFKENSDFEIVTMRGIGYKVVKKS